MEPRISLRMLTVDDAPEFVAHLVRNFASPGVGAPPISDPFPRNHKIDVAERTEETRKRWAIPIGQRGWERAWRVFADDSSHNKEIIGEISLSTSRLLETQMHRAILGIGLELPYRGRRMGTTLLATALNWAQEQKSIAWIDLGVFSHNAAARRLYENFGFVEIGRCVDCFRVDDLRVDDIQMTLDLNQYVKFGDK